MMPHGKLLAVCMTGGGIWAILLGAPVAGALVACIGMTWLLSRDDEDSTR